MKERRPPLPPGLLLAIAGGVIGTGLLVLGAMIALDMLAPPLPLLADAIVQVVMIAVGLVLIAFEIRAVLAFQRAQRDRDAD
ncbi:MAG: hypothetical protein V2J24_07055 [Pseudomonadales bacterium]|nr:hypothetical protein [Pseudomonadales bacterium]